MKICVVGCGAIGGLMGVKLALAGEDVTFVDVGPHLEAIKRNGLKVVMADGAELVAKGRPATASLEEAGPQDLVIIAVKTNVMAEIAPKLNALYKPDTILFPVQNGIPWWYFQKHGGRFDGHRINAVDPDGTLAASIDPDRIIGSVVYPAGEIVQPGVVKHVEGKRFPLGELDGSQSARAQALAETLVNAGFKSFVLDDIRSEIWLKLWGNMSFNPISALSHATLVDICQFPLTRALAADLMGEAQRVAEEFGVTFRLPLQKRIEGAEKVGKHKTSMLQDLEAGRALELDGIIGAVVELGRLAGIATPSIDAVYALTKLLDKAVTKPQGALPLRKSA